eukprot:NODE_9996_length_321_cov_108.439850.p3 GENE.NODE_9996_length_321_cov_108.439850~~NODE_9996_length_321_cov_108.439850.p3  ORF type:complete len:54 (+),score=2.95 NODE_9996_length_321_cov_108.439850:89-250(+)
MRLRASRRGEEGRVAARAACDAAKPAVARERLLCREARRPLPWPALRPAAVRS